MSALASGVVLVTGWVGERPWGMTVTSFASVSAEPPTVLVSLGSVTTSARAIRATRRFGVSILAEEQLAVARLGSEPGAAKFLEAFVDPGDESSDSPVVTGALAHLDCELSEAVQIADHTILFGRVCAARVTQRDAAPLPPPRLPDARRPCRATATDRKDVHMSLELTARTDPGARLVALAETLANEIGPRAADHDRDGSFPFDSFASVKRSGYLARADPRAARRSRRHLCSRPARRLDRLAHGDAALTLGVNMHLVFVLNVARRWQIATAAGDERRARAFGETLEEIARDGTVLLPPAASGGRTSRAPQRRRSARRRGG